MAGADRLQRRGDALRIGADQHGARTVERNAGVLTKGAPKIARCGQLSEGQTCLGIERRFHRRSQHAGGDA